MKEDSDLVKAIIKNDRMAFQIFFRRYYEALVLYVNTFTNDVMQSEDIAQKSFIKFWKKRKKLKIDGHAKSLLFKMAYNIFIDEYRKNKKQGSIYIEELVLESLEDKIGEDDHLEKRLEKLKAIIETLPEKCKEILLLNKMDGLKYREIAIKLNISIKTVEAQMRIAFQKIREGFKDNPLILFVLFKKLNWRLIG
ncbi:MAG: RNA polymerase sigma-70 factor [Cytophagaceae bacterium]|nr:RNA polymerase sigma-70 factor [Cytophagaceae bacterium]|tara:strand:- start:8256 stop:8840 length:585 start_codon:yes stop_codon:yes gene_type:complete